MPISSNNHKIADLYSGIYKSKQNQLNESTRQQAVKESLKSNYYSNTPFNKYLTDYDQMFNGYRTNVILRESYKRDVDTAIYLMQKNPELCNEIFGALGQKIKQGVQAGAQAVQGKLIQPLINMIINKLPKAKQEELAKAAQGGEQALQQFIQKEGDPNVSNELAAQGAPVAESRDHELMHAYQILSMLTMDTSGVIREDAAQNKFKQFQKTLNQIAGEIKDPNIQQQAQALSQYIQQNYTTRGTAKGAAKGAAAPGKAPAAPGAVVPAAPAAPAAPPVMQTPSAGPLVPAGGQGGIIPAKGPEINLTPGGPQKAPTVGTSNTASAAPTAQGGGSSLIGKIGSFIKNNPKLSAAAAIGLIGAIGAATGGIGFVTPMLLTGLKGAGIGAAVGAAKGALGAKEGERLKGALKGGLSGAATGGLAGAAGGLAGQALGGTGAPVDQGSDVNPNAQSPESLGTPEVDQGSEVNPNAESPESLNSQPGIDTDQIEPGSPEDPNQGMYTQPEQPEQPGAQVTTQPAQQSASAQPAGSARGGAADLQQMGNQAQAQKAAANLQPGETLKRDSLGRMMRVKAK